MCDGVCEPVSAVLRGDGRVCVLCAGGMFMSFNMHVFPCLINEQGLWVRYSGVPERESFSVKLL